MGMRNVGKPWTAADCNRLKSLLERGIPLHRIAPILGRTEGGIKRMRWAFRVERLMKSMDQSETLVSYRNLWRNVQRGNPDHQFDHQPHIH